MAIKLAAADIVPAETRFATHHVTAPINAAIDDMKNPVFWTHVSKKLRPLDHIFAIHAGSEWAAWLMVLVSEGLDVRVHVLQHWQLEDTSDVGDDEGDFTVTWGGPAHLWRVVRKSDEKVLIKGIRVRADAVKWMANHAKGMAA